MKGENRLWKLRFINSAAIKEMIIPSLLPVLSPIILYFVMATGGLELLYLYCNTLGVIITGLFVAVSMTAVEELGIMLNTLKMEILE